MWGRRRRKIEEEAKRRKGSVNGRVPVQCDDDDTSAS